MWTPIQAINLNPLMVLGRSDLFLRLDVIKKIISLVILLATVKFGLIVMAIGAVAGSLIHLMVNSYYTKRLVDVGLWMQLKDVAPTLVLSLVMFALIMAFNYMVDNIYVELFGGVVIGVVFYVGMAYILKFQEMSEVIDITKNYILKRQ
jgi:O-antigen/teichoic acid export membrane protein